MLIISTALMCEAAPLISHYQLRRQTEITHFPSYQNDTIKLIISGVGKIAVAAACAYRYALDSSPAYSAWLNIGIAGHSNLPKGNGFLAHKIIDTATDKNWYPSLVFDPECLTDDLYTHDHAQTGYEHSGGVDMEAAGFFATCNRFSTSELIHCYKVVSDNPETPVTRFSTDDVSTMINDKLVTIDYLINQLISLQKILSWQIDITPVYDELIEYYHLSQTEKLQLADRLKRLFILNPVSAGSVDQFKNHATGKQLLANLREIIKEQQLIFE